MAEAEPSQAESLFQALVSEFTVTELEACERTLGVPPSPPHHPHHHRYLHPTTTEFTYRAQGSETFQGLCHIRLLTRLASASQLLGRLATPTASTSQLLLRLSSPGRGEASASKRGRHLDQQVPSNRWLWSTLHDPYLRPHFSHIKKGLRAPCAEVRIQKGNPHSLFAVVTIFIFVSHLCVHRAARSSPLVLRVPDLPGRGWARSPSTASDFKYRLRLL